MKRRLILFALLTLIFNSCFKAKICDKPDLGYAPLSFFISDINHDSIFSQRYLGSFPLDSVKLFHKDSLGVLHNDQITIGSESHDSPYVYNVFCYDGVDYSAAGFKTFYFKRDFHTIDTIFFDERQVGYGCPNHKLFAFKYNGVDIMKTDVHVIVSH